MIFSPLNVARYLAISLAPFETQIFIYSENQIRQTAETTAASMVVLATAKATKLETVLGAQEEIATQQDQMHVTHEKVMTSCLC